MTKNNNIYDNLRPVELVFILDKSIAPNLLLKLIFIDLIHRNIIQIKKLDAIYRNEKVNNYFVFCNTNDNLNEFEKFIIEIFNNKKQVSIQEFLQRVYLLDSSLVAMWVLTTNRKIRYLINKSLILKRILNKKIIFTYLTSKGKRIKNLLRNKIIMKEIEFNWLSDIYTIFLSETLRFNKNDFIEINEVYGVEYQNIIRNNFSVVGRFLESYPIPLGDTG